MPAHPADYVGILNFRDSRLAVKGGFARLRSRLSCQYRPFRASKLRPKKRAEGAIIRVSTSEARGRQCGWREIFAGRIFARNSTLAPLIEIAGCVRQVPAFAFNKSSRR